MAYTWPNPVELSASEAEALGGEVHERTRIAFLADGVSPDSSPSLTVQDNRIHYRQREGLDPAVRLKAVDEGSLNVGVFPGWYRKADGTDVEFLGATGFALTDDATNYVYILHATGALTKNTTSFPADKTTFTPVATFVTASGDITTSDADADRRDLVRCQTHASSSSPTGTTASSFTIDNDATSAGDRWLLMQLTAALWAALHWDNTNTRFNLQSDKDTPTLAPLNIKNLLIGGSEVIDLSGDLKPAAIDANALYVFGQNATTPKGIRMMFGASPNPPASGTHAGGEFYVGNNGSLWICSVGGTPGTWQQVGKQDNTRVLSVGNGSASAGNAATCTIQAQDNFGTSVSEQVIFDVFLMDDVDGAADAPNCSAFSVTVGTQVREVVANKQYRVKADASGTLTFQVTNSIADHVYVLVAPAPKSPALVCTDTGDLQWT